MAKKTKEVKVEETPVPVVKTTFEEVLAGKKVVSVVDFDLAGVPHKKIATEDGCTCLMTIDEYKDFTNKK